MNPMTLTEVARLAEGRLLQGDAAASVRCLQTDSRRLQAGDCFVALQGPRYNGHDFISELSTRGAVAALVSRRASSWPEALGIIEVDDTLVGLQKFAANYRRTLPVQIIGVTGSSGKTSTKELIAAVLRRRYRTSATEGNLNNHIGVPLTLIALDPEDEFAVVEMGMSHPGEIGPLAEIAAPQIGVISSIGPAHIEFFPDVTAIAQEKSRLIASLPAEGLAVLNSDDALSATVAEETRARLIWVGSGVDSTWRAQEVQITRDGLSFLLEHGAESVPVKLPVFNRVMVGNALLAAAVGHACGLSLVEIAAGLAEVTLPGARMKILERDGAYLINDAYNANPSSMKAALDSLQEFPGVSRRLAVLGSMGELGAQAETLHQEIGEFAAKKNLANLIVVGPHAQAMRTGALRGGLGEAAVTIVLDAPEAANLLQKQTRPGDVVLVKGSHFMGLDQVAQNWEQKGEN